MKLRDYQQKYLTSLVKGYPKNMQPLIHLATGGGKSVIFKEIARLALKQKKKVLFVVAGTSILDQAVRKHFSEISDDITFMQGAKKYRFSEILCCSIDTLARRKTIHEKIIKEYDMVIVDEAHHCTADRYRNFLDQIPKNKWVIGFTATPYLIGKKGHTYWSNVIKEISVEKLVEKGFLMEPRIFAAPIMSTKVKTVAGEYNNKELFLENNNLRVYSDIIKEYKDKANGKRGICFAINQMHSMSLAEQFREAGISAEHADADTPEDERREIIKRVESGETKILCNVNIFSTGTDIPVLEVGIMARPTKSLALWIQQVGRVLRIHPEVKDCIILDHGGNCARLGHPLEDFNAQLYDEDKTTEKNKEDDEEKEVQIRKCPACHFILFNPFDEECPECGHPMKTAQKIKEEKDAELVEIERRRQELLDRYNIVEKHPVDKWVDKYVDKPNCSSEFLTFIRNRVRIAKQYGSKPNYIFYKALEVFGEESFEYLNYPQWFKDKHPDDFREYDNRIIDQLI